MPSLPIAVLVVRVVYQAFVHSGSPLLIKGSLLLVGFAALALTKCLLTIGLLGHATRRVVLDPAQAEREREKAHKEAAAAEKAATTATTHANQAHSHGQHHTVAVQPSSSGRPPLSLHLAKHSPSPPPALAPLHPRSPRQMHVLPHPIQLLSSGGHLLTAPTPPLGASSTACSPSLFGLREPSSSPAPRGSISGAAAPLTSSSPGLGHIMFQPLTPLALEGTGIGVGATASSSAGGSEVVSRSATPRELTFSGARRSLFELPAPIPGSVVPRSILLTAAGGASSLLMRSPSHVASAPPAAVESDFDSSTLSESHDTVPESLDSGRPPLSVNVTDASAVTSGGAYSNRSTSSLSSSTSDSALTQRFGHLRTPTALERCNSNMSPQPPVTPESSPTVEEQDTEQLQERVTTVTHTVHLQLDGGGGVAGGAPITHYAASMPVPSAVTSAMPTGSSDGNTTSLQDGAGGIPIRVYQSPAQHFLVPDQHDRMTGDEAQLDLSAAGDSQQQQQLGAATTTVVAVPSTSVTLGEGVAGLDADSFPLFSTISYEAQSF